MKIKYTIVVFIVLIRSSCCSATNRFNDELIQATKIGNFDRVQQALKKGADVNAIGTYSSTALIIAADMGHEKIVTELLKNKAHINAADKYGRTALDWAADRGHGTIVELLIKANADSNTALKKTIDNYDPGAAKLLIEHHANTWYLTENQKETLQKWGLLWGGQNQSDH